MAGYRSCDWSIHSQSDRAEFVPHHPRASSRPKWSDPMGEEFQQEVHFQNISTWLMEDVNKQKRTNLDTITLENHILHWIELCISVGF